MDELDLVRLTRPPVDDPTADALARMKTAALDAPAAPPRDGDAPDAPIELDVTAPAAPVRRRRGLVLTSIAAAVLTVGGAIAVATRDRASGDRVGSADTSIATVAGQRPSSSGTWVLSGGDVGVPAPPDAPPVTLSFDAAGGGYGITVCTTLVGSSARVVDDRLVIDDTPTGIENGCKDATELAYQDRVVGFLRSRPTVAIDGNTLTLTSGSASLVLQRRGGTDHTLDGRTFRITSLRDDDGDTGIDDIHSIAFLEGRVAVAVGCNGMSGTVRSVGTTLVVTDVTSTLMGCGGERARRDRAVVTLLDSQPAMELTDGRLRLAGGGVTLTAEEIATPPATTTASTAAPARNVLDGNAYRITSLTDNGLDVQVTATNTLVFADGRVTVKVGCNGMSGAVESADGRLVVPTIESSAADCADVAETSREALVWRLLTSRPAIEIGDHDVRLVGDDIVLTMTNRADPSGTGTTASGAAASAHVPTADELKGRTFTVAQSGFTVTLTFDGEGRASVSAGCNTYAFSFTIVDGYVEATDPTVTEKACPNDVDKVERNAADALVMRALVTIEGSTLRVANNPIVYDYIERP